MLTALQSEAARLLASNRSRSNYFAGGAVLNKGSWRLSDDLDIFTDTDEEIPDSVERDIDILRVAGFEVVIDLEIYGCTEVTVRKGNKETIIQWMSETRYRFFPLEQDEEWGLRLHMADLAVNKVLAASTRRKSRDLVDLVLIAEGYCPLGPLYLAASAKIGSFSPVALLERSRQNLTSTPVDELGTTRGIPDGLSGSELKQRGLVAIDLAEEFLLSAPPEWSDGLPVDQFGKPVTDQVDLHEIRPVRDGGGPFPDFPDQIPEFC